MAMANLHNVADEMKRDELFLCRHQRAQQLFIGVFWRRRLQSNK